MKANFYKIINALCLIILASSWQGCSVLGYGLGSGIDSLKSSARDTLMSTQIEAIEIGALIEVYTRNGNKVKGRFHGFEKYPFDDDRSFLLIETNKKNVAGSFVTKVAIEFVERVEVISPKKEIVRYVGLATGLVVDIIIYGRWVLYRPEGWL